MCRLASVFALLILAACAAESRVQPVSTSGTFGSGPAPSSKEPESSNSLPNGSATDAPLTGTVGTLGGTRPGRGY